MRRFIDNWSYKALFRVETLKRTMPLWLLIALALFVEACKKKR